MRQTEIDFIVEDSLEALKLYEKIFETERIEVTNFAQGMNEVIFSIYDVRFHMLDANPEYGLNAPDPDHPNTIWFNITVSDIESTYQKALDAGCTAVQDVTEIPDFGVSNAMFTDPFGYMWMLHEVHKEVSFDERIKMWEGKMGE